MLPYVCCRNVDDAFGTLGAMSEARPVGDEARMLRCSGQKSQGIKWQRPQRFLGYRKRANAVPLERRGRLWNVEDAVPYREPPIVRGGGLPLGKPEG